VEEMYLFYVLVRNNSRIHVLELGEELRIFVHELYEVAPERDVDRDCVSGCRRERGERWCLDLCSHC
jgi:hypothetical protein